MVSRPQWPDALEPNTCRTSTGGWEIVNTALALELALKVADIGPGDEVLVPANSFFATAEAVSNVGAKPVFTDVDAASFHLDVNSAERMITSRTRAIIPVHLYGRP